MKKIFISFTFCIFGIALALVLLEFAVRAFLPAPQMVTVASNEQYLKKVNQEQSKSLAINYQQGDHFAFDNPFYLHTPTGRRMRANAQVVIEHDNVCGCRTEIRTNSLGYRNREIGPKDPKKKRVLFLGDSITLAHYVPEERSWVRQVETLSLKGKQPLETINAGVAAVGLSDELAILTETGLSTDPDIVVLGFYLNDVQSSPGVYAKNLPRWLQKSYLAQHLIRRIGVFSSYFQDKEQSAVHQSEMEQWARDTLKQFPVDANSAISSQALEFNKKVQTFFADWGSVWSEGAWEHMKPLFLELKRLSSVHHFKLMMIIFPEADQVYTPELFDYPQQMFLQLAQDMNVPALDILPLLREARQNGREHVFYDWCHHNLEGNDLVAGWVSSFIEQSE